MAQNLPPGLTPEVLQSWLQDNPGATQEDGIKEYLVHTAKTGGESLSSKMAQFGVAPNSQVSILPWGEASIPNAMKMAGDFALMGAAGPVSRLGAGATGVLGRLGIMGSLGAAKGTLTGEGPVSGGIQGLLSQGLGEVVRGATVLPEVIGKHFTFLSNKLKWASQDAADAVPAVIRDVPAWLPALQGAKTPEDVLMGLTQSVKGSPVKTPLAKVLLSQSFDAVEKQVALARGGYQAGITAPTLRLATMGTQGQKDLAMLGGSARAQALNDPMTVREAFDALKQIRQEAADAGQGSEAHALWDAYEKGKGEILAGVPQDLAQKFRDTSNMYARGLVIFDALTKSKALSGELGAGTHPVFNAQEFLDRLQAKGLYGFVPNVVEALHRGGTPGSRDQLSAILRARLYTSGESSTVNLPAYRARIRGGYQIPAGNPTVGAAITGLAIPGLQPFLPATTASGYSD